MNHNSQTVTTVKSQKEIKSNFVSINNLIKDITKNLNYSSNVKVNSNIQNFMKNISCKIDEIEIIFNNKSNENNNILQNTNLKLKELEEFSYKTKQILLKNRIMKNKESSLSEISRLLEDFLEKNRLQFNELELKLIQYDRIKNNLIAKKVLKDKTKELNTLK